jgi:hypothetical protein
MTHLRYSIVVKFYDTGAQYPLLHTTKVQTARRNVEDLGLPSTYVIVLHQLHQIVLISILHL